MSGEEDGEGEAGAVDQDQGERDGEGDGEDEGEVDAVVTAGDEAPPLRKLPDGAAGGPLSFSLGGGPDAMSAAGPGAGTPLGVDVGSSGAAAGAGDSHDHQELGAGAEAIASPPVGADTGAALSVWGVVAGATEAYGASRFEPVRGRLGTLGVTSAPVEARRARKSSRAIITLVIRTVKIVLRLAFMRKNALEGEVLADTSTWIVPGDRETAQGLCHPIP